MQLLHSINRFIYHQQWHEIQKVLQQQQHQTKQGYQCQSMRSPIIFESNRCIIWINIIGSITSTLVTGSSGKDITAHHHHHRNHHSVDMHRQFMRSSSTTHNTHHEQLYQQQIITICLTGSHAEHHVQRETLLCKRSIFIRYQLLLLATSSSLQNEDEPSRKKGT